MLKKAGIVVVAAAAGVLAVSPLAFADDGGNTNIIPIQNNTAQVDPQICGNQVATGVVVSVIGKAKNAADNKSKCKEDNTISNDARN